MGDEEAQPEMETVSVVRAFKAAAAVMGFGCKELYRFFEFSNLAISRYLIGAFIYE